MRLLEICIDQVAGVTAAAEGGADRIELCSALALGGLTPSAALVAAAVSGGLPVMAMIRPSAGTFDYDQPTLTLMADEIERMAVAGVAGVVFGVTRHGGLDRIALAELLAVARAAGNARGRPLLATLHRAIDLCHDPIAATDQACTLGFDNILSSGGQHSGVAGATVLAAMQARAGVRCTIIAAGGVTADTAAALVRTAGARAVHASCSVVSPSDQAAAALGFGEAAPRTDATKVRALRHALDRLG